MLLAHIIVTPRGINSKWFGLPELTLDPNIVHATQNSAHIKLWF